MYSQNVFIFVNCEWAK